MSDLLHNIDWTALIAVTSGEQASNSEQLDTLAGLGIRQPAIAVETLRRLSALDDTNSLVPLVCRSLVRSALGHSSAPRMPIISDPDMALNNLERFTQASRDAQALAALFARDRDALPILLQMFSTSQYLSDFLIRDPARYDQIRVSEGVPLSREILIEELSNLVEGVQDEAVLISRLREFKQRETARIMYADVIRNMRLEAITSQLSLLAESLIEVALVASERTMKKKFGTPRSASGEAVRLAVMGLGKLGGAELNYSSDIDLIYLYSEDGVTDAIAEDGSSARSVTHTQYFSQLAQLLTRLLNEQTEEGRCYRVDLRLRPDGSQGPVAISYDAARSYYETKGRTWERQAFIKARAVAGDRELGWNLLNELTPWIFRQFLSRTDISGIKALKRRMERRATQQGKSQRDVKTGRGGIRDIEFAIQFLQMLNGGDLHAVRTENTLDAIMRLEHVGALTMQERLLLAKNYAFLRKVEHRLQIMFDLQTHIIPSEDDEVTKLAARMGYKQPNATERREAFESDHAECTQRNRQILDHLLHNAFDDDEAVDPEVDLVLDPDPGQEQILSVLEPYGFNDIPAAYRNLSALSQESIPFLSERRCRHFLASIAPGLLKLIATTPDPDLTLLNLDQVSQSLGGKGVLWELFSSNPASMELYVRMCAASAYMASLLISNPGMIDELTDSLLMDRVPKRDEIANSLESVLQGAEDIQPILSSFKTSIHLRVGIRDLLGKDDITTRAKSLADVAESILQQVTTHEYQRLTERLGRPSGGSGNSEDCQFVILALGKVGGREPNYHSDLDVIFLYECDGDTRPEASSSESTSNRHFFSQLGQHIIRYLTEVTPQGRLYEIDARLRPTGKSGSLAVSFEEFSRYFADGEGQLWERLALCKARPVYGSQTAMDDVMQRVHHVLRNPEWQPEFAGEIRKMRAKLETPNSSHNLKRGVGGTVDVEFTVQALQLKHGLKHPEILVSGTVPALEALAKAGLVPESQAAELAESYRILRQIESAIRLMNTAKRHELPQTKSEMTRLAYLLREEQQEPNERCEKLMQRNRELFLSLF